MSTEPVSRIPSRDDIWFSADGQSGITFGGDDVHAVDSEIPPIVHVRLMNEYAAYSPLWEYGADGDGPYYSEVTLSDEIWDRLVAWGDAFDEGYDPDTGWSTFQQLADHHREGTALYAALRAGLEPEISVEFNFWETCVNGEVQVLPRVAK